MKNLFLFILLCSLFACLLGSVLLFEWYYAERIYPGVRVWGVDLGGERPAEAATPLAGDLALDQPLVILRGPDRTWSVRPVDLGLRLDPDATLSQA